MFSLIITIIAVALVVVILAATMYHGGDSLTQGQKQAQVAKALNELEQIQGALVAYNMKERKEAASLQDLVPGYLSSVPSGWGVDLTSASTELQTALASFEVSRVLTGSETDKLSICNDINAKLDIQPDVNGNPPSCIGLDPSFAGCCMAT